jgi:hypothetical protein
VKYSTHCNLSCLMTKVRIHYIIPRWNLCPSLPFVARWWSHQVNIFSSTCNKCKPCLWQISPLLGYRRVEWSYYHFVLSKYSLVHTAGLNAHQFCFSNLFWTTDCPNSKLQVTKSYFCVQIAVICWHGYASCNDRCVRSVVGWLVVAKETTMPDVFQLHRIF